MQKEALLVYAHRTTNHLAPILAIAGFCPSIRSKDSEFSHAAAKGTQATQHTYVHTYLNMFVCMCVCVCVRAKTLPALIGSVPLCTLLTMLYKPVCLIIICSSSTYKSRVR